MFLGAAETWVPIEQVGVSQNSGYFLRGPYNKDYSFWGLYCGPRVLETAKSLLKVNTSRKLSEVCNDGHEG